MATAVFPPATRLPQPHLSTATPPQACSCLPQRCKAAPIHPSHRMSDIHRLAASPAQEEPIQDDLAWLVEAQGHPSDAPHASAAASREQHPFDQGLAMLPELATLQQGSVPASGGSTFSAAASSPAGLRVQAGGSERQATYTPPVSRLITTGLRSRAPPAEQLALAQEPTLRSTRAASESTTGTPGASESPAARGGRVPRARSGTFSGVSSVREGAAPEQRTASAAQQPDSPGVYRSLRKRPNLNYAQTAGDEDSESDASSFPMSEEEEEQKKAPKQAEPKKGQRGRKRRTEPVVVTREDGTREEVSPQVYRRLRRRVTNRLSARRMRQKRAEERESIAQETTKLQQENTALKGRMAELEGANRGLARDVYNWRTRYEQLAHHAGLPSTPHSQQHSQQPQPQVSFVSPPPQDRRSHSMPTPQQLPDPLQRSISPGGFDSFSLATDFPSLSMLSPHSQLQQQAPSLPRQQLPSYDLASGLSAQRIQGGRSVLGFFPPLPPVHTGSPTEIATPQMEREHLHGSHAGGMYSGGFTHLQSPPFPGSPRQTPPSQSREAGPSMERALRPPRHFSAPNLSQGIGDVFPSSRMLEQQMPSPGMAFAQQGPALDLGSYAQQGLHMRGGFGQPSPRSSQAARSSAGMKLAERSSAPVPLPVGHLGSAPFGSHLPLPNREPDI